MATPLVFIVWLYSTAQDISWIYVWNFVHVLLSQNQNPVDAPECKFWLFKNFIAKYIIHTLTLLTPPPLNPEIRKISIQCWSVVTFLRLAKRLKLSMLNVGTAGAHLVPTLINCSRWVMRDVSCSICFMRRPLSTRDPTIVSTRRSSRKA